jgi:DNA-binding CsgD family transcriptional regulator
MPPSSVQEDTTPRGKVLNSASPSRPLREVPLPHQLIGDIYDAVLDPSLWPSVLAKAASYVGGRAASLFSKDSASKSGVVVYDHGIDAHYKRLYLERYVKLDPTSTGQFLARIGEPVATDDVIPYDEFLATRFYREWAEPQGLVDFVSSVLDRSATSVAMFGVFRDQADGLVDEETRQRMRLITPHIRRAVLIGKVIDLGQARATTFHEILDGLSAGMFLVDASSRLVHANAAGRAMLANPDFLRLIGGRLVARDPAADRAFRSVFAAAADGDAAVGTGGIAVPLVSDDGDCYVAHVLPMTSGARHGLGRAEAAVAALFVHKAVMEAPSLPAAIARHYKLTPTELRVLLSLLEVGSGPAVAEALGVAESTVKTHLARIYQKTGTRRQLDLVKLVAGFANPLLG